MHMYAKQVLCRAGGKVMHLPHETDKDFYRGYFGMLRINKGTPEAHIPGTSRRCDVLLYGKVRTAESGSKWNSQIRIAVEIAVTNFKDEAYRDEIRRANSISVLEVPLSWQHIRKEAERLRMQYHEVVGHIVFRQGNSKYWIFKKGGEAWVCPSCEGYKKRGQTICYQCLA